jgi:DNA-binding FrmR family transcriptional regulator
MRDLTQGFTFVTIEHILQPNAFHPSRRVMSSLSYPPRGDSDTIHPTKTGMHCHGGRVNPQALPTAERVSERVAHPHQHTKAISNQLARTAGHVTAIKRMVDEGQPCADVLIQLGAVRAAIDRAAKLVLEDHVESCLRGAAENGLADDEWARLKQALDTFIR